MSVAAFTETFPEPGFRNIVFDSNADWPVDCTLNQEQHDVLSAMKKTQRLSIVEVAGYSTSLRGPPRGVVHPKVVIDNLKKPGLVLPFGNYHLYKNFFRDGRNGHWLGDRRYKMTVGETSLSKNFQSVDKNLRSLIFKRVQTDGSHGEMGPSLDKPYVIPGNLDFRCINGAIGFNEHFAITPDRERIKSPLYESLRCFDDALTWMIELLLRGGSTTMSLRGEIEDLLDRSKAPHGTIRVNIDDGKEIKISFDNALAEKIKSFLTGESATISLGAEIEDLLVRSGLSKNLIHDGKITINFAQSDPHNPYVRCIHPMYGGSLAHAAMGNERSAVLRTKYACYSIALTCVTSGPNRDNGMRLDEWQKFCVDHIYPLLGIEPGDVLDCHNTDGAANIIQALRCSDGSVKILAKGGLGNEPLPTDLSGSHVRSSPNYLVLRLFKDACDDVGILRDPELPDEDNDNCDKEEDDDPLPKRLLYNVLDPDMDDYSVASDSKVQPELPRQYKVLDVNTDKYGVGMDGKVQPELLHEFDVEKQARELWYELFVVERM
ncbi:hypothetical protein PQX77_015096 [Marasmius sp. AFHP31]|nr:hypothetical protein PQX77_015096 [Marasmius sp. AFHP31]